MLDKATGAILVLNCGSSSLKYKLYATSEGSEVGGGVVERIGLADGPPDHRQALLEVFDSLRASGDVVTCAGLRAIAHRVVHGGERFVAPCVLDSEALAALCAITPLAPLHNPASLQVIELAASRCREVPQLAVFDTAFHHTLPAHARHYALPQWAGSAHGVRRYGFHGISVQYVSQHLATLLGRALASLNLIVLHLGNGASATALARGQSVDTSMGMTPLEGLVMGTRCGDLDAAIPFYLMRESGMDAAAVERLLFEQSGLHGLCGAADMRQVHRLADGGDPAAALAREISAYRLKKYIGAYLAVLGRVDALIFTGGIGEHDAWLREQACHGLQALGIELDGPANRLASQQARRISTDDSPLAVWVIPTDEERLIADSARQWLDGKASTVQEP